MKIIVLDSQVPALEDHGQRTLHVGLVVHELFGAVVLARQLVDVLVEVGEQADEVRGCARTEPVVVYPPAVQRVEQAEGIVHVRQPVAEVVAVVLQLQPLLHFLRRTAVVRGHVGNGFGEITVYLVLRDAAQRLVTPVHADVLRLVETAEHAHLRELRHARQQHKLQVLVRCLEHGVEGLEHVAVPVLERGVHVEHVQHRFVVFVNKHHGPASRPLVGGTEHLHEAVADTQCFDFRRKTVLIHPTGDIEIQFLFQFTGIGEVRAVEVHMKYGMHGPFRFQSLHGQPAEQLPAAQVIVLQRGHEQALAEAAGAAQEIDAAFVCQIVD